MVRILFIIFTILVWNSPTWALSEYGRRCDDNPDCVECRDEIDSVDGLECQQCMNNCWNFYGPAEFDTLEQRSRDKDETCRMKWAKWCNAQCWDPDDRDKIDYVSTKPICTDHVFPKYQDKPRPW